MFTSLTRNLQKLAAIIAVLSLFLQPVMSVSAAFLNTASYTLNNLIVSTATDHTAHFKTPTGVDAPTDTVVFTYAAGFNLAGITIGDIDLSHGVGTGLETPEALAALPGVGIWGASIVGNVIIFTAPTDAALGEIASNDFIVVKIGANALGGVGQIVNPAVAQNAVININGTFGDTIGMGVPIMADNRVTISARVGPEEVPPAGGGGGGVGDIVPPIISNVQAINITSSTAEIIWQTNESSNSAVEYGLTTAYSEGLVTKSSYVWSHSIKLANLKQKTVYHFRVSSRDSASNMAFSGDYSFTTLGDDQPPIISNLQVVNITDTSALVIWNTDEPTDSGLEYGLTSFYGSSHYDPTFSITRAMFVSGLTPNTLYHYLVTVYDGSGNVAMSLDATFTTLFDISPPSNVTNFSAVGGDAVVHLSWTPPSDFDFAGVKIIRKTGGFPMSQNDGTFVYDGSLTSYDDTQVVNGATYYYGAFAYDTSDNFSSGALAFATPQGPTVPVALAENTSQLCSNGIDDDADGKTDCQDSDCVTFQACKTPTPVKPPPEITTKPIPTPGGKEIALSPHFFTEGKTIELIPDHERKMGVLENGEVYVFIPRYSPEGEIERAYIIGSLYNLAPTQDGTAFDATITVPSSGVYDISIVAEIKGGGTGVANYQFVIHDPGKVVEEEALMKTEKGIADAKVTLYVFQDGWKVWNGAAFNQSNPIKTNEKGEYEFVVSNGKYYAVAEKDGYMKISTEPMDVVNNLFVEKIGLIKTPAPIPLPETATSVAGFLDLIKGYGDRIAFGITYARVGIQRQGLQEFIDGIFSPSMLAIALINLAVALPVFNSIVFLQYLFTQPLLLFGRRKKKQWGVVFNSLTKQPIDLAIVRLLQAGTRMVVQTTITDKFGRYTFLVKEGNYIVEVVKQHYLFPTRYLMNKTSDVDFVNLYHAMPISARDGQAISLNIPVDPLFDVETPKKVLWRRTIRIFQQDLAFFTVMVAVISLAIKPSTQVAFLTLAHVGIYLMFRRLSFSTKAKEWGIVFDEKTRKPLDSVIVRIFDKKYNKLLETKVTDKNGKYGFFVRRNVYYVTAEREGYEKFTSPYIDLSSKDEALVDQNLSLVRVGISKGAQIKPSTRGKQKGGLIFYPPRIGGVGRGLVQSRRNLP
jgi:hypothetical protein